MKVRALIVETNRVVVPVMAGMGELGSHQTAIRNSELRIGNRMVIANSQFLSGLLC